MTIPVTATDLRIIEQMAGMGSTLDDIALILDWSVATLDRKLKLPEVESAYKKGRAIAKNSMASRLWDIAMSGDEQGQPSKQATTACIFWLKAQAGWTDRIVVETETADDSQKVVIFLPDNGR